MIPHTLVLKPGLVIHRIYNGYWFWGRPSVVDLWHDLRAVTSEIRPDWDLSKPGLREAWDAGDHSLFHGWNKRASEKPTPARRGRTMTAESTTGPAPSAPGLAGQTVVVIGGSAGIGLETARRARAEGADVILTARDPDRLRRVGAELGATHRRLRRDRLRTAREVLRRAARADRPRAGHGPRSLLCAAGGVRRRQGAPRRRGPSPAAAAGRSERRAARFAREGPCSSWAAPAAAARRRDSRSSRRSRPRSRP